MTISNSDDIIDSRDVIERIEELQTEHDAWVSEASGNYSDDWEDLVELDNLQALRDEAEGYAPDWNSGAALIRDSYFKEYAQELAEDLGAIPSDAGWPAYCIDWNQAARDLQVDYTSVEFDGIAYWVR